jgi:hypothetical protein
MRFCKVRNSEKMKEREGRRKVLWKCEIKNTKREYGNPAWWFTLGSPALRSLKVHRLEVNLGYAARSCRRERDPICIHFCVCTCMCVSLCYALNIQMMFRGSPL